MRPAEKRFVYEFHCDDAIEERSELAPSVQMQIYRIVQEAVNNIWRHAEATEVKMFVTITKEGDFLFEDRRQWPSVRIAALQTRKGADLRTCARVPV